MFILLHFIILLLHVENLMPRLLYSSQFDSTSIMASFAHASTATRSSSSPSKGKWSYVDVTQNDWFNPDVYSDETSVHEMEMQSDGSVTSCKPKGKGKGKGASAPKPKKSPHNKGASAPNVRDEDSVQGNGASVPKPKGKGKGASAPKSDQRPRDDSKGASALNALCIPMVFNYGTEENTRRKVFKVFRELNVGFINDIVMTPKTTKKGEKCYFVVIHIRNWFRNDDAEEFKSAIMADKTVKVPIDDPWFWKVTAYKPTKNSHGNAVPSSKSRFEVM